MDAPELLVERRGEVAVLTLARAAKRNALHPALLAALAQALDEVARHGARAAVLTGEGDRVFSSGYDLEALPDGPPTLDEVRDHPLKRAVRAVAEGPLPVVAALNGPAVGGGCELAAACDLRVAHPEVTLTMPPLRLGLVYSAAGLGRFVALVGPARTRELFLTGLPVEAPRALAWGLVDRVVPRAEVLPTALGLAEAMACGLPGALAGTRRALALLAPQLPPGVEAELLALEHASWTSAESCAARAAAKPRR